MTTTTTIRNWEAAATDRTNNVATSICSPITTARLRNLFSSSDVADAIEFYTEDTEEELFTFAKEGDDLAAWALLIRLLPWFNQYSRRNGDLNIVVDEDDIFQMVSEAFFTRLDSTDNVRTFRALFLSDARHTAREAQSFSTPLSAPSRDMVLVRNALRAVGGDLDAAYEAVNTGGSLPSITRERFLALVNLADPRQLVQLDAPVGEGQVSPLETLADPTASTAFNSVLGSSFDSEDLEDAWAELTDREREILDRRLGISSGEAETATEIALDLGVSKANVSQIHRKALGKIRDLLAPRRNATQPAPVEPKPVRRTKAPAPVQTFEVEVRTATDEAPVRSYPRTDLPVRPAHTPDLTKHTAPLVGNGAWGGYHRPVTKRVVANSFVPTSDIYFEPHWDRKTAERLAPAKARKSAAKSEEAEELLRFARSLRQN